MPASNSLNLSGNRFAVAYRLSCPPEDAWTRAQDICFEQTVEFPAELLPPGEIRDHLVGRVESLEELEPGQVEVLVSYAVETVGAELTQLLNVVFGNISLKPGIRLERLELPDSLLQRYQGPRFGRQGLRALLGASGRPLLATALKPMGLSPRELADQAYEFALGGIDIIKDDHGLTDQPFAPFRERVERCAEAVCRANRETGGRSIYVANVTAPEEEVLERALLAKGAGAGGLLVCPGLTGFDTMRRLAEDDRIALSVISHPAFLGSWVTSPTTGISHYALFGQIMRLAGADAVIYPNWGGRFSFSRDECRQIAEGCEAPMADLKPSFPTPAGGMSPERVPEMLAFYGQDAIFLMGGGLHRDGPDLARNSRRLLDLLLQYR